MTNKVVENIAKKYENIRKGVKSVMGGKILEYEAKTILNQGKEIGFSDGFSEGKDSGLREKAIDTYRIVQNAMKNLNLSVGEACDLLGVNPEEYKKGERYLIEKDE